MKKILIMLSLVLSMTSCDDFLTKVPDTAIPEGEAMTDLESASQVVLGIYSTFKDPSLYSGDMILTQDIQADYVYAVKGFTNVHGEAYRWDVRPNTTFVNSVYAGLYRIASRCNFFMDYKHQVEPTLLTEEQWETYNSRLGDVHFARALAYSDLIRIYCEAYDANKADEQLGIALATSYVNSDEILLRSSLKESYEFVLADLDRAEELVAREGADSEYFTKGAVYALKARVYLYMQEWEKAKEYSKKVMDLSYYQLADAYTGKFQESNGEIITEYDVLWRYDEGNEIIWKIAMSTTDKGGSLGRIFLGFNSNAYYPDYIPGNDLLDMYDQNDGRSRSFFGQTKTGWGWETTILKKYPGNSDIDAGIDRFFVNKPKVFRLSEMYLVYAEACAQLGDGAEASKALNELRAKRINGGASGSYPADEALEEIKKERYKELVMEGFRLADLKRYKQGFKRKPQANTLDGEKEGRLQVAADRVEFTWPIPQHDIDASGGLLQGNPSNFK